MQFGDDLFHVLDTVDHNYTEINLQSYSLIQYILHNEDYTDY